jgi:hypothetical protein
MLLNVAGAGLFYYLEIHRLHYRWQLASVRQVALMVLLYQAYPLLRLLAKKPTAALRWTLLGTGFLLLVSLMRLS